MFYGRHRRFLLVTGMAGRHGPNVGAYLGPCLLPSFS
jgi:hypothetical protein